ncbi:flagellar basal body P-ring formation chaperone FlgA [Roseovarius salinarum]|uniref:flagellar basal body P-ring formation chaperone FlgA n=1 Tax=Roseovarius salinarum TaxID=1981892 RepID=UPI000C32CC09|nr:flagellar basal body P-ring formation chaperone FlgA [Roseovarius salinarum]
MTSRLLGLTALCLLVACTAAADTVLAARTIRAQAVISPADVVVKNIEIAGAATSVDQVVGKEARVALYAGRPVRPRDIGPPAIIERNQIVPIVFESEGLHISAEGRSLSRAGPGERVRVMNLSSRTTLFGTVEPDGTVRVSRQGLGR